MVITLNPSNGLVVIFFNSPLPQLLFMAFPRVTMRRWGILISRLPASGRSYLYPVHRSGYERRFGTSQCYQGQLSILVRSNPCLSLENLKQAALIEIEHYAEQFKHHRNLGSSHGYTNVLFDQMTPPEKSDAVFIAVSQEFTTWLEDDNFMSRVLHSLFKSSHSWGSPPPKVVDVVTSVVDGVSLVSAGITILHGRAHDILPNIGSDTHMRDLGHTAKFYEKPAFLSFRMKSATETPRQHSSALTVTVPLANTIFQNGKASTLLASRWLENKDGFYIMEEPGPWLVSEQIIIPETTRNEKGSMTSFAPLEAVTPPRKIVSGLGNIIRQVNIDEMVTPASRELEGKVTMLLAGSLNPEPIMIWAAIAPFRMDFDASEDFRRSIPKHLANIQPILARGRFAQVCKCFEVNFMTYKIFHGG